MLLPQSRGSRAGDVRHQTWPTKDFAMIHYIYRFSYFITILLMTEASEVEGRMGGDGKVETESQKLLKLFSVFCQ